MVKLLAHNATCEREAKMIGPSLRDWQKTCHAEVVSAWRRDSEAKVLIAACPGAGKTQEAVSLCETLLDDDVIDVALIVVPTVAIKNQWGETLGDSSIKTCTEADNESLRMRRDTNGTMAEDNLAICVTYAQLAKDHELFVAFVQRHRTLLIADEVHHADDNETFGAALDEVASEAAFKLALSGTPFNSSGGALAMCESHESINDEGRLVRETVPLFKYSYADAISDGCCRPVEFIKRLGKSVSTFKSLADDTEFQKVVDLAKENKSDSIGSMLDCNGNFMRAMLVEALDALRTMQKTDKRAGMLIVAKDKKHGEEIKRLVEHLCDSNKKWSRFRKVEIYHDTTKAHNRITDLEDDNTDIVITVRMISEGVDVKRLRVGVYATDYRTRMFFIQFVGRFIRYETRLPETQHALVLIPGHISLLTFAREIEKLVHDALIPEGGEGPEPGESMSEFLERTTEATGDSLIFRGKEEGDRHLVSAMYEKSPKLQELGLPESTVIAIAKELNVDGSQPRSTTKSEPNWRRLNEQLVRSIVKYIKKNGNGDNEYYSIINGRANRVCGIARVDNLTPELKLKQRHAILKSWYESLRRGEEFDEITG